MDKKKRIFTAVISMILIFAITAGCLAVFTGCSETEIRMAFSRPGAGDVMMINGHRQKKIPKKLYEEMFNCVKDLNKSSKEVNKDELGDRIYNAKEYGTYIHLGQKDGKYVTYISVKGYTALWGEIPDRTNATGKITHGEAYFYNITPQAEEEIKKAEKTAEENMTDKVIPK